MNLHELYTAVVAANPAAEIVGLEYHDDGIWSIDVPQVTAIAEDQLPGDEWKDGTDYQQEEEFEGAAPLPSHMMSGIILQHWLSLMAPGDMLQSGDSGGERIWWGVSHGFGMIAPPASSPVFAVGNFLIEKAKKQGAKA